MNGPTMRRCIEGSARRTLKPATRSAVRGRRTSSIGEDGSRSANGSFDALGPMSRKMPQARPGCTGESEHPPGEQEQSARVAGADAEAAAQPAQVPAGEADRPRDV